MDYINFSALREVREKKTRDKTQKAGVSAAAGHDQKIESSLTGPKTLEELAAQKQYYIDLIHNDYNALLDKDMPFATPHQGQHASHVKVAVVGGGIAGLATAYNLLRCGINVDLYEATTREDADVPEYGGRLYSLKSGESSLPSVEMGAMRYPAKSAVLWKYLYKIIPKLKHHPFGLEEFIYPFPNPGQVATAFFYKGDTYYFGNGKAMPQHLVDIVNKFVSGLQRFKVESVDKSITIDCDTIAEWLASEKAVKAHKHDIICYFNAFLKKYHHWSLGKFLKAPIEAGGASFSEYELDIFYYLGIGTGGFGPLYPIALTELLRLYVWKYGDEYQLPISASYLAKVFYDVCCEEYRSASEEGYGTFNFIHSPVTEIKVAKTGGDKVSSSEYAAVKITYGDGQTQTYARTVVATSHRVYQTYLNLDAQEANEVEWRDPFLYSEMLKPELPSCLRGRVHRIVAAFTKLHSLTASKLFTVVENPERKETMGEMPGDEWPAVNGQKVRVILSDKVAMQSYFLMDELGRNETCANVLASYLWGEESRKCQALCYFDGHHSKAESWAKNIEKCYNNLSNSVKGWQPFNFINLSVSTAINWEDQPYINAGFKLLYPGEELGTAALTYQYQFANDPDAVEHGYHRVFLAGESCSFAGGWVEGALISAIHASVGVLRSLGDAAFQLSDEALSLFEHPYPYLDVITLGRTQEKS